MTDAARVLFSLTLACLLTGGAIFAQDGSQIVAARSYTNFGEVDSQGFELGVSYVSDGWDGSLSARWVVGPFQG